MIRLWNSLDNETVNSVTLQQFKSRLPNHVAIVNQLSIQYTLVPMHTPHCIHLCAYTHHFSCKFDVPIYTPLEVLHTN